MKAGSVTIIGAGPAGAALAVLLARRGFEIHVIEQRNRNAPGFDNSGPGSLNLALSRRATDALEILGISSRVLDRGAPMRGRLIHTPDGRSRFQPYGARAECLLYSVPRRALVGELDQLLAEEPDVQVVRGHSVSSVDTGTSSLTLVDSNTRAQCRRRFDVLIGADGARSTVRRALGGDQERELKVSGHAWKQLRMDSKAKLGAGPLALDALHIWPRGDSMMIGLPNLDGSLNCALFIPTSTAYSSLVSPSCTMEFVQSTFPDALSYLVDPVQDLLLAPPAELMTVDCSRWYRGRVAIIGDAAHAVLPFYGQGANAALEDALILDELIGTPASSWEQAFRLFEATRRRDTNALAIISEENYVEMCLGVTRRLHVIRKRLEHLLESCSFGSWRSTYTLVSFTRTSYEEATRRPAAQLRVLLAGIASAVSIGVLVTLAYWIKAGIG